VTPRRQKIWLVVRAIYRAPPFFPLLGKVSISRALFDTLFKPIRDQYVFVNVRGEPGRAEQDALERSLVRYPDALVQTREEWIKQQDEDATQFLNFLYILLALSVIVSLFGMVNTLVLSVFERTRELGMLRAIGMTQPQARRMVRNESVVTALIGATLGLPLGIFLALLVNRALSEFDVAFVIPIGQLVAFGIVAVFAGILAAIVPARRAARLRVLEALHYE
jgi:putative ABC transport system permease protein